MAQLVIAAAGAALGGFLAPGIAFLGMTGAQLGWMAGSMLGSALGPKQRSAGPRLDELRVTGTEYGNGIPWIAGAPRVAGDLIWASDRREIASTEEVGKGGGGSEYTSYTYELDALYLLADQPDAIVTRCWENGKLIWTNLASADDASRLASESTTKWRRITVYSGADAQMPDPIYEAAVTNAPGYTRRLTLLIEGLQLGASGTLPNLTFEVASKAETNPEFVLRHLVEDTGLNFQSTWNAGIGRPAILRMLPTVQVAAVDGATVYGFNIDGTPTSAAVLNNYPSAAGSNSTGDYSYPVGLLGDLPVRAINIGIRMNSTPYALSAGWSSAGAVGIGFAASLTSPLDQTRFFAQVALCSDGVHAVLMTSATDPTVGGLVVDRWHLIAFDGSSVELIRQGDISPPGALSSFGFGNSAGTNITFSACMLEDDIKHLWVFNGAGSSARMFKIDDDGILRSKSSLLYSGLYPPDAFTYPTIWAQGTYAIAFSQRTYQAFRRVGDVIIQEPLRSVVEDLCDRATMPAGTYDASALAGVTQPVRALAVSNGSARQALEILQSSHGFDAYVTDRLYFVPRGGAPVLTIDADDLAAGENDAQDEPFALTVNADLEMPSRIAVVYKNMSADQVNGTEHSERGPAGQDSIQSIQLAIGMTPGEAKGVADAMVRDAYAARLTSSLSLPMAYTHLTPTDVIQVPGSDGMLYRMRVTRRSDSGGIIALDVVGDDASVTVPADGMTTSTDYAPQGAVIPLAETQMVLLDIPLLRDVDDAHGLYVATKGSGPRWPGANVLVSANGADYTMATATPRASVIGLTTTALGNWTSGAVMDEINSVTVSVGSGQLASTSRAALLADRAINAMLIGNEVIRFTTAALVSSNPNVYTLTRLLRGQLGTEWAQTGHATGDRVVLLSTALRSIPQQAAEVGLPRYYRAVTSGASAANVSPVEFSAASVRKKPYSPANVRLATAGAGSYSLTWERRTRLETVVRDGLGVLLPLGEDSEAYSVDALNADGEVVQTLNVSTPEANVVALREAQAYTVVPYYPHEWSGSSYGLRLGAGTPSTVVRMASDGSVAAESAQLPGQVWDIVYTGTGLAYAITTETSAGGLILSANRLYRIDLASMGVTASIDLLALSSGATSYHLVFDGSDLWTALNIGGILQKHNPTTLAVTSTIALGNTFPSGYPAATLALGTDFSGTLFVGNREYNKLLAYRTTGSPGVVWEVEIPPTIASLSQIFHTDGVLFVAGSQGVGAFNAADGALLFDYGERSFQWGTSAKPFGVFDGYVIYSSEIATVGAGSTSYSRGPTRVLDPASGVVVASFSRSEPLLAVGGVIYGVDSDGQLRRFEPLGGLSGGQFNIYQVSATVGRGYPATISIP